MISRNPTTAPVFRRLHEEGLLVLANAWDAGSARLIESLGAKAIATSSAAAFDVDRDRHLHHPRNGGLIAVGLTGGFRSLAGLAIMGVAGGVLTGAFGGVVLGRLASAQPATR